MITRSSESNAGNVWNFNNWDCVLVYFTFGNLDIIFRNLPVYIQANRAPADKCELQTPIGHNKRWTVQL